MLAQIHEAIQPSLETAGFSFDGRNNHSPVYLYIDYSRGNDLFRVSWDRRTRGEINQFIGFVAEILLESGQLETIRSRNLGEFPKYSLHRLTSELRQETARFSTSVSQCLDQLSGSTRQRPT